jgi:lipoprotein-anchoring transpeptidase ErfK/SrfK
MRIAIKLVITLLAISLVSRASAHHATVVINLTEQAAYLIEDGGVSFISPIASGKLGWGTPTGNFRVIKRDANHQSGSFGLINDSSGRTVNTNATPGSHVPPGCRYQPAPMPYFMEFAKNFGMHAGYLPGFPASHGCVRMPKDLAADFFARVQVGTPVKITGSTRNVTRVRKAIPLVQPGDSAYAVAAPKRDRHAASPRI